MSFAPTLPYLLHLIVKPDIETSMQKPITTFAQKLNGISLFKVGIRHFRASLCRFTALSFIPYCSLLLFLLSFSNLRSQCFSLACNDNVTLSLGQDCEGSINSYFLIANPFSCGGPTSIEYFDDNGNSLGNILNSSHIGQTINAFAVHEWTGLTCMGSVTVVDNLGPQIDCENITLKCTEAYSPAVLGTPTAQDNCSAVQSLTHQDEVIDLGCGSQGFEGYFDPSNWMVTATNGDGGVDVTGAPNSVLVQGASTSPFNVTPRYITKFKIEIPTEGYVSFDWSSFGGSNFNVEAFYVTINDVCIQLSFDDVTSGSYTTWLLQPGDVLSFEQASDGTPDNVNTEISNFQFITSAYKIIHRHWTAVDSWGNSNTCTQVITLERATLADVHFPPNHDGLYEPMLNCGDATDPFTTGFPFLDDDGNLTTTHDQFDIENGDCTFGMTYTDQVISTCPGSEIILREWRILDDCTSQIVEEIQIIKRFDTTPPDLICPANITVGTSTAECSTSIILPPATASDACTGSATITPEWDFGSGFGPYEDVPLGNHQVIYKASDGCGNATSCAMIITIEDHHPPTVVCDAYTVASLTSDGTSYVYADVVDDGSYDLCCLEGFTIKRSEDSDDAFAPFIMVDCDDASTTLMVKMKATDCTGNYNVCEVEVTIEDQQAPAMLAPADVTVDCSADLSDLSIFGEATGIDNCQMTLNYSEETIAGTCGQGTIIRSWIASDPFGNSNTVTQNIFIASQNPWNTNGNAINWPQDYTTNICQPAILPTQLPPPFGEPTFIAANGCESIATSYDDEWLWISEPACYIILRTWTVIDWCQYVPNAGPEGKWEYVQTLEVNDHEAPIFDNTANDLIVEINSTSNCYVTVELPTPAVTDCSDHIALSATGDLGNGMAFSNVSAGIYNMIYSASDGCGNTAQHHFTVTVIDSRTPTALCINNYTLSLEPSGSSALSAAIFDLASFDNCTNSSDLIFSFSNNENDQIRTYTCDNVGTFPVEIWVTDATGNQSSCSTSLTVHDGSGNCNGNPNVMTVGGNVFLETGEGVSQVTIDLQGSGMPSDETDFTGTYFMQGNLAGGNYMLVPQKDINILNGVTAYDLTIINNHVLGNDFIESPYQLIAADANNSGTVTVADITAIQRVILHMDEAFQNNTSWRFIASDFDFPDPTNPFLTTFPESMPINSMAANYQADFIGVKIGDVSNSVDPSNFGNGEEAVDRNHDALILEVEDRSAQTGELIEILFKSPNFENVLAYQFTLTFDANAVELIQVDGEKIGAKFGKNLLKNGALTSLWTKVKKVKMPAEMELFSVKFKAKQSIQLSEVLQINSDYTKVAAFNLDEEQIDIQLQFTSPPNSPKNWKLYQNYPNPFHTKTKITFDLPEAGAAVLTFFDLTGKELKKVENYFNEGYNELIINNSELGVNSSVVYYKLEAFEKVEIRKMILLQD